jgi:hypothetical protein
MDWHRISVARARAKGMFMIAGFAILMPVLLWIAGPRFSGGASGGPRVEAGFPISDLLTAIGIGGVLFGLAWMWRIFKAPTKYDGAIWRYRDR